MLALNRVAVVYMLKHPGGVQSCVISLISGLNQRGIVPDILWDSPPCKRLLDETGAKAGFAQVPFRISSNAIQHMPETLRYLAWVTNTVNGAAFRERYDCFFVFYNGFLVPPGVPHVYYLSGPPLLPQLEVAPLGWRGIAFRSFRRFYQKALSRRWPAYEFHRGRNYVINSRFTADLFHQAHGVRLPVIYPSINLAGRGFEPEDLKRRDTILFFSRIVEYKRPELVMEISRRFPGSRCVIMGGVTPNQLVYFESLRQHAGNAIFIPNPSERTVREELARARFYIFPAVGEHFGMTTPEAIASGAIPFVHDSGGQREIVPDERLRFSDSEMLQKFTRLTLMAESELNGIRSHLRRHVQQYSAETYVARMLAAANPAYA